MCAFAVFEHPGMNAFLCLLCTCPSTSGVRPCLCPAGRKRAAPPQQAQMGLVSGRLLMKVPVRQICGDGSLVPGQQISLLLGTPGLGPGCWWSWEEPLGWQTRSTKRDPSWLPIPAPGEAVTEGAAPPVARTQGQKDRAAGRGVGQVRGAWGQQWCAAQQGL